MFMKSSVSFLCIFGIFILFASNYFYTSGIDEVDFITGTSQLTVTGNLRYHYRPHRGAESRLVALPHASVRVELMDVLYFNGSMTLEVPHSPFITFVYTEYTYANYDGSFLVTFNDIRDKESRNFQIVVTVIARDVASFVVSSYEAIVWGDEDEKSSNAWRWWFTRTPEITTNLVLLGNLDVAYRVSGAFNILRFTRQAYDLLLNEGVDNRPPTVPIVWNPETTNGTSNMAWTHINLNGARDVQCEWNLFSIIHEYAHWDMWQHTNYFLKAVDPWGFGSDYLSPMKTFSEGWATYFAQVPQHIQFQNSVLRNNNATHSIRFDLTNIEMHLPRVTPGIGSPAHNAAALWGVTARDMLSRPFINTWNTMAHTMQTAPSYNRGTPQAPSLVSSATLLDFFDNYFSLGNIAPNTAAAYDFWRNFEENGMNFDSEAPTNVTVDFLSSPHDEFWIIDTTFEDNVMVGELRLYLNGIRIAMRSFDRYNIRTSYRFVIRSAYFEHILQSGINAMVLRAFDHGGNLAISRPAVITPVQAPTPFSIRQDSIGRVVLPPIFDIIRWLGGGLAVVERPEYTSATATFYFDGGVTHLPSVAVLPGGWDNIRVILSAMGVSFQTLTSLQANNIDFLSQFDILFVACNAQMNAEVLRQFVSGGGIVYASDLSGGTLQAAFPNHITMANRPPGNHTARIIDTGLAAHMGMNYLHVGVLPGFAIGSLTPDATVFLTVGGGSPLLEAEYHALHFYGESCCEQGNHSHDELRMMLAAELPYINVFSVGDGIPISASFRYGDGRVFYTAFHHSAQITANMTMFIEYLVFSIEHTPSEDVFRERAAERGYFYAGAVFGTLGFGETSQVFSYSPQNGSDFRLMLDTMLGEFALTVTDPLGRTFVSGETGIIEPLGILNRQVVAGIGQQGIAVTNPLPGTWTFTVTSHMDASSIPFAVGIAERPSAPVVTNYEALASLHEGHGIFVTGFSPAAGTVTIFVASNNDLLHTASVATAEGGHFTFALPYLPEGSYTFAVHATDDRGTTGRGSVYEIIVNGQFPTITISDAFERLIYSERTTLHGTVTNTEHIRVTVNGLEAYALFALGGLGNGYSGRSFSAALELREGENKVVVTATSRTGLSAERTLVVMSDTTTPDEERSTPHITDFSLAHYQRITVPTTVYFTVLDSHLDDTLITARAGGTSTALEVTPHGNNRYSVIIEQHMFLGFTDAFTVFAENRWRNSHMASVPVFVRPFDEAVMSTSPTDFISVLETSRGTREWELRFHVTEIHPDGSENRFVTQVTIPYPSANLRGTYVFQSGHRLYGHTLIFDIRNNGANAFALGLLR